MPKISGKLERSSLGLNAVSKAIEPKMSYRMALWQAVSPGEFLLRLLDHRLLLWAAQASQRSARQSTTTCECQRRAIKAGRVRDEISHNVMYMIRLCWYVHITPAVKLVFVVHTKAQFASAIWSTAGFGYVEIDHMVQITILAPM